MPHSLAADPRLELLLVRGVVPLVLNEPGAASQAQASRDVGVVERRGIRERIALNSKPSRARTEVKSRRTMLEHGRKL